MTGSLYLALPEWQILYEKALGEIDDVKTAWIMHSPAHYGESQFFETIMGAKAKNQLILTLDLDHVENLYIKGSGLEASFKRIAQEFVAKKVDRVKFVPGMIEFLRRVKGRLLIVVRGGAHPEDMVTLLDGLWLTKKELNKKSDKLKVIALDDYRLLYYDRWKADKLGSSVREFFEMHEISRTTEADLVAYFSNLGVKISDKLITDTLKVTGGNFGLVAEVAKGIIENKISVFNKQYIWKHVEKSLTATKIRERLFTNLEDKAEDILEFKGREIPIVNPTPLQQGLQSIGILYRDGLKLGLFPGIITEMVEATYEHRQSRFAFKSKANKNEKPATDLDLKPSKDDFTIIHLSDIHLEEKFSFVIDSSCPSEYETRRDIIQLLEHDLQNQGLSNAIDAIILSGDFTNFATKQEFDLAQTFVNYLLSKTKLTKDKLVIAAGNHDISWDPTDVQNGLARSNYAKFRSNIGKGPDCLCEMLEFSSKSGKNLLRIVVMDSNLVESRAASGIGFISPKAFGVASALMQSCTRKYNQIFNVLVVHHHVFPVGSMLPSKAAQKDVSLIANASELIEFANKHRFGLILHGHEHKPCISQVSRWVGGQAKEANKKVLCLGAGSFSAGLNQLAPYSKNHYYIITIGNEGIKVRSRVLDLYSHSFSEEQNHFFEH